MDPVPPGAPASREHGLEPVEAEEELEDLRAHGQGAAGGRTPGSGDATRNGAVVRGVRPNATPSATEIANTVPSVTESAPSAESAAAPANATNAATRARSRRLGCERDGCSASERIVTPAE